MARVEMMQRQVVRTADEVVPAPFFAEPVRTAQHEPVEHSEENRPFHVKAEEAIREKFLEHLPHTELIPQSLEDQSRTDLFGLRQQFALSRKHQQSLLRESGEGAHQAFDLTLGNQPIQTAEGRDDSLIYFSPVPVILNNLEILVWT